jgi:hypothetical protein
MNVLEAWMETLVMRSVTAKRNALFTKQLETVQQMFVPARLERTKLETVAPLVTLQLLAEVHAGEYVLVNAVTNQLVGEAEEEAAALFPELELWKRAVSSWRLEQPAMKTSAGRIRK